MWAMPHGETDGEVVSSIDPSWHEGPLAHRLMSTAIYAGPDRRTRDLPVSQERRKPGRKPLAQGEDTSRMSFCLPASLHDKICKRASLEGVDDSAIVRLAVEHFLDAFDMQKSIR
jgi:hypothetical protein